MSQYVDSENQCGSVNRVSCRMTGHHKVLNYFYLLITLGIYSEAIRFRIQSIKGTYQDSNNVISLVEQFSEFAWICCTYKFDLGDSCIFVSCLMADLYPNASLTFLLSPRSSLTSSANKVQSSLHILIYEDICYLKNVYHRPCITADTACKIFCLLHLMSSDSDLSLLITRLLLTQIKAKLCCQLAPGNSVSQIGRTSISALFFLFLFNFRKSPKSPGFFFFD